MKVLAIMGESGTGKTHLANLLDRGEEFNMIRSYTTRKPRGHENEEGQFIIDDDEVDHFFVSEESVDAIFDTYDIAASSEINGSLYWTLTSQFKDDKINVYVVDSVGFEDMIDLGWDVRLVFIHNDNPVRENKVHIPIGIVEYIDFHFDNTVYKNTFKEIASLIEEMKEWGWK